MTEVKKYYETNGVSKTNNEKLNNIKKITTAESKIERNHLKKEIEKNKIINLTNIIIDISNRFDIPLKNLINLIERESGMDTKMVSKTGAKGIMQLTEAPLKDMENKNSDYGFKKYSKIIQKLPEKSILVIKNKWIREAFLNIHKNPDDKKIYYKNIVEITKRAKDNAYCNFLVGCIYLGMLKENINPDDKKEKQKIISNLKKIDINQLNKMLLAKNKQPLEKKDLENFINKLNNDKNLYLNFVTFLNYNGDNSTHPWKIPHKYYYATSIINAKEKTT